MASELLDPATIGAGGYQLHPHHHHTASPPYSAAVQQLQYPQSSAELAAAAEAEMEDLCAVDIFPDRRWYLVAVLGTSLSAISLVCNSLIACVLLRRRNSNFFFLGLLSLSDCFLSACYGPVIAMDIIKNRLQILWLSRLWWGYVGPLLALCHVSMSFSCFMIILGCYERWLITKKSGQLKCFRANRAQLALCAFLLSLVLRGTSIFEIEIVRNGNCTGLAEFEPRLSPLATSWFYGTVFRFYFRTIATVFVPFITLLMLNGLIVHTLRKQNRSAAMFRFGGSYDHKMRVRSATRLLLLIVASYLIANLPNVLITSWEFVNLAQTQSEEFYDLYETVTDVISMLYVLSCASRLGIYLTCNEELRDAFYAFVCTAKQMGEEDGGPTEKTALQRQNSYTPMSRQISLRKHRGSEIPIGTDFDRVVVAMAISRVSSFSCRDDASTPSTKPLNNLVDSVLRRKEEEEEAAEADADSSSCSAEKQRGIDGPERGDSPNLLLCPPSPAELSSRAAPNSAPDPSPSRTPTTELRFITTANGKWV